MVRQCMVVFVVVAGCSVAESQPASSPARSATRRGLTDRGRVADANGDGHVDLAVTNTGGSTVSVFLGSGDGVFQPRSDFGAGDGPFFIAVADLNLDRRPDLVVTHNGSGTVTVRFGRCLGHGAGDMLAISHLSSLK